MDYYTPRELDELLRVIKEGHPRMTDYEAEAKRLAKKHGLSESDIDDAVKTGREMRFDRYIGHIKEGHLRYEPVARELADKHTLPHKRIDDAIEKGHLEYEPHARKLAEQYGFSKKRIDDAVEGGETAQQKGYTDLVREGYRNEGEVAKELIEREKERAEARGNPYSYLSGLPEDRARNIHGMESPEEELESKVEKSGNVLGSEKNTLKDIADEVRVLQEESQDAPEGKPIKPKREKRICKQVI